MENNGAGRIIPLIQEYEKLRERKDELAEEVKENNAAFKKIQEDICTAMVEEDIPKQGYNGFTYSPQTVTHYSFVTQEKLQEMNADKIEILKGNEDFRTLIKEEVNAKSFDSFCRNYIKDDPDGELPEDIAAIVSTYDELKINRRAAETKAMKAAKEAVGRRA